MTTDTDTMGTIADFVRDTGVRMACEWIDSRPDRPATQTARDREWDATASHYRCTLRRGRKSLRVYFSMGSAHTSEPTITDVLDCLASDIASWENAGSFEDWCGEYGYDTDSRRAERDYRAIERQIAGMDRLFTRDELDQLLWHTERL